MNSHIERVRQCKESVMYSIRFWLEKSDFEKKLEMEKKFGVYVILSNVRVMAWRAEIRNMNAETYNKVIEFVQLHITSSIHHNAY